MAHNPGSPAVSSAIRRSPCSVSRIAFSLANTLKILARHQPAREIQRRLVQPSVVFGSSLHAGQDQRRARLVDEDTVRLVDDRKMQTAQQQTLRLAG